MKYEITIGLGLLTAGAFFPGALVCFWVYSQMNTTIHLIVGIVIFIMWSILVLTLYSIDKDDIKKSKIRKDCLGVKE